MPQLRKDPVTERWVIIATERARRPNDFYREKAGLKPGRVCPFCPGHESQTPPEILAIRHGSAANHPGWSLRVVPNKYPVLGIEGDLGRTGDGMFDRMEGIGAHEVIIESSQHADTMAAMSDPQVESVLWAFRERMIDLKKDRRLRYILIFKNHGAQAGATLEHPHSQLIALPVIPRRVQEELDGSHRHHQAKERCIFCDILRQEVHDGIRVVTATDDYIVLEPYASRLPFETHIYPRRHQSHFELTENDGLRSLARVLKSTLKKLGKVLEDPAYNFVIHTAPVQTPSNEMFHWHIEIVPKLTRVAGFEWGTGFYINPTPPEEAASFLQRAEAS